MNRLKLAFASLGLVALAAPSLGLADEGDGLDARVEAVLSAMSLRAKVGQVFMVTTPGPRAASHSRRFLTALRPGAITLFRYHLADLETLRRHNDALRAASGPVRPFIAIDQEGGKISRLRARAFRLPAARWLGRAADEALAEAFGRQAAEALRAVGIDMNLAPVLDQPREGGGRYLRARAFGGKTALVAKLGEAYVRGLHAGGVAAVAKHFPGEGTSRGDPHRGFPTATASERALREIDGAPFRTAGADAVMVGHVRYPVLGKRPASLEPAAYRLARDLGYGGVAMTDGLEMRSIRARFGTERAAVMALAAGADMISLFDAPRGVMRARDAVVDAVKSGALPMRRLDEAVRRVLRAKARRGLLGDRTKAPPLSLQALAARGERLWDRLGARLARRVKGQNAALPPETKVASHDGALLRRAGERGLDLRTAEGRRGLRALHADDTVLIVAARGEERLARRLVARGLRVARLVAGRGSRARRRAGTDVFVVPERTLLGGALGALLTEGRTSAARP